jgi:hypothetical protein
MLAELTQAAESLGLEVRSRALRGTHPSHGGLVRLPGRMVVFLSSKATPIERCTVLAAALAELGHTTHPALGRDARELVERRGRPQAPRVPHDSKPGLAGLGGDGRRRS